MAVRIVHRLAVKFRAMFSRMLSLSRKTAVVPLSVVECVIYVPVEMIGSVVPGPSPDEYTAVEPFRAIIAVRSAVVRRSLIVAVRAHRGRPDAD
jgi:hypothetical protein